MRRLLAVEVEAKEGVRDPHLQDDREHPGRGRDDLDLAVSIGREVVREERQQDDREDRRDEPADPVDRGVSHQAPELAREVEARESGLRRSRSPGTRRPAPRRGPGLRLERSLDRLRVGGDFPVDLEQPLGDDVDVVHLLDVVAALRSDLAAQRGLLDERAQRLGERLLGGRDDRQPDAEGLSAALHGLRVEVADDRLCERHRLEREDAVPARVELVDDDVGAGVPLARLVVRDAFDEVELDRELRARRDHELRALLGAVRGGVDDERAPVVARRLGEELREIEPGRDHVRLRHPADRVVGADDLGVGAFAVGELLRSLAADVRAEVVVDALLAGGVQNRELHRLGDEREAEVEVEDVGVREQPRQRSELRQQPARQAAVAVERPVGLGMEAAAVDDDEPRVHAGAPQRLHVLPGDAGHVDGAVGDLELDTRVGDDLRVPPGARSPP